MISRHKNKAYIGVAVWLAAFLLMIAAAVVKHEIHDEELGGYWGAVILFSLAVQYLAFFWGGRYLAKAKGHTTGLLAAGVFLVTQGVILGVLLFGLPDRFDNPSPSVKKTRRNESSIARIVRYRRNALVFNGLGVAGVLLALALTFMPSAFFLTRDNAQTIGLFVFVAGYAGILYGCWWWVRAKKWTDTVVFIGLSPLALFFVPWVRLIYLIPGILPLVMVMMPLLMIGVVAVLPDKSGMPQRKRWGRG